MTPSKMKGILELAAVCLLAVYTDAQIMTWGPTADFTFTGANGKIATMTIKVAVPEGIASGTKITAVTATPTASGATVTYAFATSGNPGDVGVFDTTTTHQINLAAGKSLNFETTPSIVFIVTATEATKTAADQIGTATVTVTIKNKLEFSQSKFGLCANDGLTGGSVIGTFAVTDAASGETVAYGGVSNSDMEYVATTGVLKVASGKTLKQATTAGYALALTATGTVTGSGTASENGAAEVFLAVCDKSGAAKTAFMGAIVLSIIAVFI